MVKIGVNLRKIRRMKSDQIFFWKKFQNFKIFCKKPMLFQFKSLKTQTID